MRLHDIRPAKGATKRVKRLGRGESSGKGKTSGKGHKGQKARAGKGIRPGFEGGQMPLYRRLPKRGFSNAMFRDKIVIVDLSDLEAKFEDSAMITESALREKGLVSGKFDGIKLLGDGAVTKKFTIALDKISASAKEKIEKAGGSFVGTAKPAAKTEASAS